MFNIAICDDEETLIGELKENLIKYAAETNKEFCFFIYHDGSVYFKEGIWFCQSLFCVCAPWARSNGCKSRTRRKRSIGGTLVDLPIFLDN